ncbi:hypothetical protein ERUR111494_01945 [Erysipelothrix urinaevulpis]|uniref:hypothetical protein n=1 Tax=Erysipelothrix urinaevulpis TaxID=2683717 RepID=UPI00135A5916|nr:hypothetical protein [Erysipelothrix urinaevulpis]
MTNNKQRIYNFPHDTYTLVDIEKINLDLENKMHGGRKDIFENMTTLHQYFAEIYTDSSGNEIYSYDDIRRFLGRKKGGISHKKAMTLANEFGLILKNDETFYMTDIEDVLQILTYQKVSDIRNYLEPMDSLEGILTGFRDILLKLESSQHFNYIPNTTLDGFAFFGEWICELNRAIFKLTLGNLELKTKLMTILEEIEFFIRQYEVPGVVERWLEINPSLAYYDVVYQIMDEHPQLYEKIRTKHHSLSFSFYPSKKDLINRNQYFESINKNNTKKNLQYSQQRLFQNELEKTLNLIIDHDLIDYLHK